ncbi:MAG: type II secretion system protein, partial [Verrucomicrobiales bacterium]
MTTHPTPQYSQSDRHGFTLIELLVVIAIIGLLVSITIPIYRVVNEGTNSARSLANLKNIGSTINLYTSENNNQLPVVDGEELPPLDWTNVTIELEEDELEDLPYWTKTLMHFASKGGSDVSRGVFNCPGLRWKNEAGKKIPVDEILLAYGVTEAMNGFDEDNDLTPYQPRALASIENKPNTI